MGYCMSQEHSKFTIKRENRKAALRAIKDMANKPGDMGGGSSHGKQWNSHYSWMNGHDFSTFRTLTQAMEAWRWPIEEDGGDDEEFGNIVSIEFQGEKLGDDDKLFAAIAPFVEAGSFIEMRGEDGDMWRWVFDGTTVKEVKAKVVWEDSEDSEDDLPEWPNLD